MVLKALSFNEDAQLYDKMRPKYSDYIFSQLQKLTGINNNSKILEVGCGTGQATQRLARVTRDITCVDPGENMINIARKHLPDLKYELTTFEDFNTACKFDLILSATAWHWVDPKIGYKKAHKLLRNNGYLAVLHNYHSVGDPGAFHKAANPIYVKYGAKSRPSLTASREVIIKVAQELENQYFHITDQIEEKWQQTYSIDEYIELRNTYSDHRSMDKAERITFEKELRNLADTKFGGSLTKNYTCVLFLAKKKI